MIREFAGPVEADLAFQGIDFRDFYRPGGGPSGLSLRRLFVLICALPYESATHTQLRAAEEKRHATHLRSRRDHYARQRERQEREEAPGD